MTAVEYLQKQLFESFVLSDTILFLELIDKAKVMEKKQREEDLESGFDTGRLYQGKEGDTTLGQLKSKTFKSE